MNPRWQVYTERYRAGEWRAPIFLDMVLEDARSFPHKPVLLDIGCGGGFDGERDFQQRLSAHASRYIGIEPDPDIPLAPCFSETYRCLFEDAPLAPGSIDLAFAVMVLEHLENPQRFWDRLYEVLADGGIFWGFTVDARHWFSWVSLWLKRLRLTDFYLDWLRGRRGVDRYHNYPVHYRANSPELVLPCTGRFAERDFINFQKIGQLNYYLPRWLRPVGAMIDRRLMAQKKPGAILAMRLVKAGRSNYTDGVGK